MYKIGVYGSAEDAPEEFRAKIDHLGEVLGSYKDEILLVTGACPGVPLRVVKKSYEMGSKVWGFSPVTNIERHKNTFPDDDVTIYEKLYYISNDYKYSHNVAICNEYRNLSSTAFVDAGIVVAGRWGTLNEFTNLVEMGKNVGVLTGTGGTADSIEYLQSMIKKHIECEIILDDEPVSLVEKLLSSID